MSESRKLALIDDRFTVIGLPDTHLSQLDYYQLEIEKLQVRIDELQRQILQDDKALFLAREFTLQCKETLTDITILECTQRINDFECQHFKRCIQRTTTLAKLNYNR